jgi:peptide/nickel transport system substrate-binding protein
MKEKIINHKLKSTVLLSRGMFSPAFAEMYQERPIDQFDPELAKKLLTEAGFKLDNDKVWSKNGIKFILNWRVSNNKSSIEVAETIKFFLEKNGILVNLIISEWGSFMSNYKKGNFDVLIAQWLGFNGPDMLRFVFHSENTPPKGGNRINYQNAKFDEIIDQAVRERDSKRAILDFKRADDLINLDYAYINLWHPNVLWLAKKCVSKLDLDPTASFRAFEKLEKNCEH